MLPIIWLHLNVPEYPAVVLYVLIKIMQVWNILEVQGQFLFKMPGICLEWQTLLGSAFHCVLDKLIEVEIIYAQGDMEKTYQLSRERSNLCYVFVLHFLKSHRKKTPYIFKSNLFHNIFPSVYEW